MKIKYAFWGVACALIPIFCFLFHHFEKEKQVRYDANSKIPRSIPVLGVPPLPEVNSHATQDPFINLRLSVRSREKVLAAIEKAAGSKEGWNDLSGELLRLVSEEASPVSIWISVRRSIALIDFLIPDICVADNDYYYLLNSDRFFYPKDVNWTQFLVIDKRNLRETLITVDEPVVVERIGEDRKNLTSVNPSRSR